MELYATTFETVVSHFLHTLFERDEKKFKCNEIESIIASSENHQEKIAQIKLLCQTMMAPLKCYDKSFLTCFVEKYIEEYTHDAVFKRYYEDNTYDLTPHTYALYNAIQLKKRDLPMLDAMKILATEPAQGLTPNNFKELLTFLTK